MGMTDMQWKSHLRALIEALKQALEISPDNAELKKIIARFEQDLES